MQKLIYIISIIVNAVYYYVLNLELYVDRYHLPDGEMGEHSRSPVESLYTADNPALWYLQLLFMLISAATGLLLLFGVNNRIVKIVQIVGTIASTLLFVIILFYTKTSVHPRY